MGLSSLPLLDPLVLLTIAFRLLAAPRTGRAQNSTVGTHPRKQGIPIPTVLLEALLARYLAASGLHIDARL